MGSCCASVLFYQQHFTSCVLLDILVTWIPPLQVNLTFASELAVGNVNTKMWEKVNSFSVLTKVGGKILYFLNDIVLKIETVFFCSRL